MKEWGSKGGKPADRESASAARAIIERLLPELAFRKFVLGVFAELITDAAGREPKSWSVTLFENRVRLNVGNLWAMDIGEGGFQIAALADELPEVLRERVTDIIGPGLATVDAIEDRKFVSIQLERGDEARWPKLRSGALEWVAAVSDGRARYATVHSPGVVRYLENEIGTQFEDAWQIGQARGYEKGLRSTSTVYAFQANPDQWDLVTELPRLGVGGVDTWRATAHHGRMRRGDVVLFWSSKGKVGRPRGCYGVGRLLGPAKESESGQRRVEFVLSCILEEPILEDEISATPGLENLKILGGLQGTNFSLSADDWYYLAAAFPQLLDNLDIELPEGPDSRAVNLREAFQRFRAVPENRVMTELRRRRSGQIRELLTGPPVDVETFQREVWRLGVVKAGERELDHRWWSDPGAVQHIEAHWNEVAQDGNSVWMHTTWVFAPKSTPEERQDSVRDIQEIARAGLAPPATYSALRSISGLGPAVASGIAMLLHPTGYAIFNGPSSEAMGRLGLSSKEAEFQASAESVRTKTGADDFLELDWFLFRLANYYALPAAGAASSTDERRVRYLKVAPGRDAWQWDECKDGGFIAIGWDELGDLSGLSLSEFEARVDETQQAHPEWTKTAMWQVWYLARLRVGDKVVANKGISKVLGFGTVSGEYYYVPDATKHRHRLPIDWDDTTARRVNKGGWRKTAIKLSEDDWTDLLNSPAWDEETAELDELSVAEEEATDDLVGVPSHARNLILYGPPGTGKTYLTARRAVELCLSPDEALSQADVVAQFRELHGAGNIEFITFHQSYGYEEFVEGIRPVMDEDGESDIQYRCEDGVFKRIALRAAAEGVRIRGTEPPFEALWSKLLSEIADAEGPVIERAPNGREYVLSVSDRGKLRMFSTRLEDGVRITSDSAHFPSERYQRPIWKHRRELGTRIEDYSFAALSPIIAEELGTQGGVHGNINWIVHVRLLRLLEQHRGEPMARDRQASLQGILREGRTSELNYDGATQYVLIVDEINRGNMSKILGELITLLEPSKRLTKADELVVQLPYTKELFAVPPNLHVVGTMNTADRSIALMDVALRRRFEFVEMMPDMKVVVGALDEHVLDSVHGGKDEFINLVAALFDCINARIRFLYDDDHQLGHSYFMKATSYPELRETMLKNVIPMLQEYFYGSWDRVCAALGCPYSEGEPGRKGLVVDKAYRDPFIVASIVKENELLGFDHLDFEDAPEYAMNPEWLDDASPERMRRMCIDALSGSFAQGFEARSYYP